MGVRERGEGLKENERKRESESWRERGGGRYESASNSARLEEEEPGVN